MSTHTAAPAESPSTSHAPRTGPTASEPTGGPAPTASEPGPRWPAWARTIAGVACYFAGLLAAAGVSGLVRPLLPAGDNMALQIAFLVGSCALVSACVIGLLTLYLRLVERRPLSFRGLVFTRWSVPMLLLGVAVSCAVMAIASGPAAATGTLRPVDTMDPSVPVWVLALAVFARAFLLQGLPEELVFRGYLVTTLRRRPWVAVAVSTGIFTAMHLLSNGGQQNAAERALYLAIAFGFSLSAVGLALLTRSLWAAVGIHGGLHVANAIASANGIGDGPAMWIALGTTHTVVGLIALALWARRGPVVEYVR